MLRRNKPFRKDPGPVLVPWALPSLREGSEPRGRERTRNASDIGEATEFPWQRNWKQLQEQLLG